jgi:hypothetical protein
MKKRLLAAVAMSAISIGALTAPAAAITVAECKQQANALLNDPTSPYYAFRSLATNYPGLWDYLLTRSCRSAGATP